MLEFNRGISVIRDCSAGSDATTILCMDEEKTFYRKYALKENAEKLLEQVLWINRNRKRLALPEIIYTMHTDSYCFYDMKYSSHTVGLFEYAHSMPVEATWGILQNVLDDLESIIYQCNERPADSDYVGKYIEAKLGKNIEIIRTSDTLKKLYQFSTIRINGRDYRNLKEFPEILDENFLRLIFIEDPCSEIHGDLTVENIICTRDDSGKDGYYLIDPNTGNIHDSKYLDYAKLLQSVHGGYEFINLIKNVRVDGNDITFDFTRSTVYKDLHTHLRERIIERFGKTGARSIYFHEIIHWLRLIPYKIRFQKDIVPAYYAVLIMVINDVINEFGGE